MEENRKQKGKKGEDEAVNLLISKGYKIVSRNYIIKHVGEIDIIARDKDYLVFVEVRSKNTKNNYANYPPEESIDRRKITRLKRLIHLYFAIENLKDQKCRLDIITIYTKETEKIVNHYENIT